jgi:hypothetical protein
MGFYQAIKAKVKLTNNGKLWLPRLEEDERIVVEHMVKRGYLSRASVLERNDAVRLTAKGEAL